ncbi:MAG: HD domain-containing protein [Candidatus Thorarchaeota archaeon]
MMISINSLEQIAQKRKWQFLLAKSSSYGSQSLLSHSKAVSGIAATLGKLMGESKENIDLLRIAGFLHDIGKMKELFQTNLRKGKSSTHLPTKEDIADFADMDEDLILRLFILTTSTHLGTGETIAGMQAAGDLVGRGETSSLIRMGDILKLADAIASSTSSDNAFHATQRKDLKPLIRQSKLKFAHYNLQRTRGILTFILHKSIQEAYRSVGFEPIAFHIDGCLLVGNQVVNEISIIPSILNNLRSTLTNSLLEESFLESSTAMQINSGMIANESIVSLESSLQLIEYALNRATDLPGKSDDQKRSILLRFISTLQNAIRTRLSNLNLGKDELDDVFEKMASIEKDLFGIDFNELGLPMSYTLWVDKTKIVSDSLLRNKIISRSLNTMPIEDSLIGIKKAYVNLIDSMNNIFEGETYFPIHKMDIDIYLAPLLEDISYPRIDDADFSSNLSPHEIASKYLRTYTKAKGNCMGQSEGNIRCPICGSSSIGTPAKRAGVGSGTKKFMNLGQGRKRLDNVNVCSLCILEGILREQIGYGYVLMPQIAFSVEEAEKLRDISQTELRKLDRKPFKSVGFVLDGKLSDVSMHLQERLDIICNSDREPFRISKHILGNFVLMTTYPETSSSDSENMALILFQALVLHLVTGARIKILSGLEMIQSDERTGAVIFSATSSLLKALGLRTGSIQFDQVEDITMLLAAAIRAKLIADLSERNGTLQALTTHPGQLAQRIVLKRDFPKLTTSEMKVLTTLMKGGYKMGELSEEIAQILDKYYRPEKYGKSMHSILGPMNALYTEFRKASDLDEEAITAIGGKVHRQLQQLNKGDYLLTEASVEILEVCRKLASSMRKIGPRGRKKMLDDLRYAVYLRRLIAINEKIDAKKGGKTK